jgi:hypothetical protein
MTLKTGFRLPVRQGPSTSAGSTCHSAAIDQHDAPFVTSADDPNPRHTSETPATGYMHNPRATLPRPPNAKVDDAPGGCHCDRTLSSSAGDAENLLRGWTSLSSQRCPGRETLA